MSISLVFSGCEILRYEITRICRYICSVHADNVHESFRDRAMLMKVVNDAEGKLDLN